MLVHRNAAGEPELLSTIARDVSGRSRAEEALRRRERDFRTLRPRTSGCPSRCATGR
jgi:hypothetical protein